MTERLCFLLYLFFCSFTSLAQQVLPGSEVSDASFLEKNRWAEPGTSLMLDSMSVVPESIRLLNSKGEQLDAKTFLAYNYDNGVLEIAETAGQVGDSVQIVYQVLPFSLQAKHQHKTLGIYDSTALFNSIRFKSTNANNWSAIENDELFSTPNLTKSGSLSRGITFGNRQDVFVNADLNLQLEGALTDKLRIRAAISDQNIPMQPEGNTQQIQDFDKVYIELFHERFSLQAGDILLTSGGNPAFGQPRESIRAVSSNFLTFQRNVKGALFKTNYQIGETGKGESSVGIALSKGKFASVTLQVENGVQGPYQIILQTQNQRGSLGQSLEGAYYLIANSEKVYLDGELLKRGYDQDYVIDYNLGEITFTSKILITKYSRINIEFEYADRNYSRTLLTARHQQHHGNLDLYVNFFQEKDNPNQPMGFDLSQEEKLRLSEMGQVSEAYVPSWSLVESVADESLVNTFDNGVEGLGALTSHYYEQIDTTSDGQVFTIFKLSQNNSDVYKVSFTEVGEGNGNYRLASNLVNGKIYEWVSPIDGKPSGNYEPVQLLNTPKMKKMVTMGGVLHVGEKDKISGEFAFSDRSQNLYAQPDNNLNQGNAFCISYDGGLRKMDFIPNYKWSSAVAYEFRKRNFTEIDPTRSIEFDRDWGIYLTGWNDSSLIQSDDHLVTLNAFLEKNSQNKFHYQLAYRDKGSNLTGLQQKLELDQQWKKLILRADLFLLHTDQQNFETSWNKLSIDSQWQTNFLVPGYRFRIDQHQVSKIHSDSVVYSTNNFQEHQFYLQSPDSTSGTMRVDYSIRKDKFPMEGVLLPNEESHTLQGRWENRNLGNHQLALNLAYRQTFYRNDSSVSENSQQNKEGVVLGGLNWNGSFLKRIVRTDLNYSISNGRELKREFVYVRVPAGEGTFTWRDDNGNGIEEIQEFYEAIYADERNYARIFVATNEYILAYANQLKFRVAIQPPIKWEKENGLKGIIGKFSANTSWSIDRKVSNEKFWQRLLPTTQVDEEQLLNIRETFQSTIYYNLRSTKFGMEASLKSNRRKQLLNLGFDERALKNYEVAARWSVKKQFNFRIGLEKNHSYSAIDTKSSDVDASGDKQYQIDEVGFNPTVSWQPGLNFRVTGRYAYTSKSAENLLQQAVATSDIEFEPEKALFNIIGCDVKFSKMQENSLTATIELVDINFEGEESSAYAYEMLEGLKSGVNGRWSLVWQQKIWKGLQLSVQYQGRKSADQAIIHSGNMQVRALF